MPEVSVIVPVYNARELVGATLDSLRAQTLGRDLEVVVVLDAPTDGSDDVVRDWVARHAAGFTIVDLAKNVGLAGARQTGVRRATGRYITFLDSDDWVEPATYATMLAAGLREEADVVACGYRRWEGDTTEDVAFPVVGDDLRDPEHIRDALKRGHSNRMLWFAWRNLFSRSMLDEHGIEFVPELRTGEDMVFNLRAYGAANRVAVVDDVLLNYRQTPGSLTQARHLPFLAECLQLSYDLKAQAAEDLGIGPEFMEDMNRYVVTNTLPRLLSNAVAGATGSRRAAVEAVLSMPMVQTAVRQVSVLGSGAPRGIQLRHALARAGLSGLVARLY